MKTRSKSIHVTPIIALLLGCIVVLPKGQAVTPPPDGGYPGGNTAEGTNALFSLTTGGGNTADGTHALFGLTSGEFNTAVGYFSLPADITGSFNTAVGAGALFANTGQQNTAIGAAALLSNTTGSANTANGEAALFFNTTGDSNTAVGSSALLHNTTASSNTAIGGNALSNNTQGENNTAVGVNAMQNNTTGDGNTAIGIAALLNSSGNNNIAVGIGAGTSLTTGDNNIYIGNGGVANEDNTLRVGTTQTRTFIAGINGVDEGNPTAVFINTTTGQLGTTPPSSSRRFKKDITPMNQTSQAILGLKPVTFQYKNDTKGRRQFGLIAEEVAEVDPDLVLRDENGAIYTVRYDAVNAMLLNEFLREHHKVEQLEKDLRSTIAQQQKRIEMLTAGLQEVSAQLEISKATPQTVLNNQ